MNEVELKEQEETKPTQKNKLGRRLLSYLGNLFSNGVRNNALQALPFWIASLLTGLVAVGYTKMFGYSEGLLQGILHWHAWLIFIMTF
jgi:hypothetical protein